MRLRPIPAVLAALTALTVAGCSQAGAGDPLSGTSWRLLKIESMAPAEQPDTVIDDPDRYTVEFGPDGRAAMRLDCNRGSATFQTQAAAPDSGSLTFGPIGVTRMFCPQPSADAQVGAALGRVRSYLLADGRLYLSLEADSGIMHFEPAAPAQ
jgi:heat shock protein HslJ